MKIKFDKEAFQACSWYGKLQRNGFTRLELLTLGKICDQNFIN